MVRNRFCTGAQHPNCNSMQVQSYHAVHKWWSKPHRDWSKNLNLYWQSLYGNCNERVMSNYTVNKIFSAKIFCENLRQFYQNKSKVISFKFLHLTCPAVIKFSQNIYTHSLKICIYKITKNE